MNNNIKLSKKQKETILLMQNGWQLSYFVNKSKFVTSSVPWLEFKGAQIKVGFKVADYLKNEGLIEITKRVNPHVPEAFYTLTELGKTIKI